MVLDSQRFSKHNTMLGRKIPHPTCTKFHEDVLPPAKRFKIFDNTDGEDSRDVSDAESVITTPDRFHEVPDSEE